MRELKYDLEREAEFEEIDKLKNDFSKKSIPDLTKTFDEPIELDDKKDS